MFAVVIIKQVEFTVGAKWAQAPHVCIRGICQDRATGPPS
jgi:hypothetical protein